VGLLVEACPNLLVRQASVLGNVWIIWVQKLMLAMKDRPVRAVNVGTVTAFQVAHVDAIGPGQAWMRVPIEVGIAQPRHGPALVRKFDDVPVRGSADRHRAAVLIQLKQHWHVVCCPLVNVDGSRCHLSDAVAHHVAHVGIIAELEQKSVRSSASFLVGVEEGTDVSLDGERKGLT
jgi:hypothetical protein